MKKIKIPRLDANIDEGTLGNWLVEEGATLRKGQPLVEYITDKAVFEIEAPVSGCLLKIVMPAKSSVPTGVIIGLIGKRGELIPDIEAENQRIMTKHARDIAAPAARPRAKKSNNHDATRASPGETGRPRATLPARRLARAKGIALEDIRAKVGNRLITAEMVEDFFQIAQSPAS